MEFLFLCRAAHSRILELPLYVKLPGRQWSCVYLCGIALSAADGLFFTVAYPLDVKLPGPGLALPGGGGGGGQHEHGGLSEGDGEETVLCSFSIFFLFSDFSSRSICCFTCLLDVEIPGPGLALPGGGGGGGRPGGLSEGDGEETSLHSSLIFILFSDFSSQLICCLRPGSAPGGRRGGS